RVGRRAGVAGVAGQPARPVAGRRRRPLRRRRRMPQVPNVSLHLLTPLRSCLMYTTDLRRYHNCSATTAGPLDRGGDVGQDRLVGHALGDVPHVVSVGGEEVAAGAVVDEVGVGAVAVPALVLDQDGDVGET